MTEEFVTNPTAWAVEGNIVGEALGFLEDLEIFTGSNSLVASSTPEEIDGKTIDFIEITYSED